MPDDAVTACTLCHRALYAKDANSRGRCVDCAGKRADDSDEDDE